jgi:hypothetical protein
MSHMAQLTIVDVWPITMVGQPKATNILSKVFEHPWYPM